MLVNSLQATIVILILLAVGWFMSWKGWMSKEDKPFVIKLIVNIGIPAMIIINLFESFSKELLFSSPVLLLAPLITIFIAYLIAVVLANVIEIDKRRKGSFIAMCTVSNSVFIGLPVCQELFGNISIPYAMFYYIVNTTVFWAICNPRIKANSKVKNIKIEATLNKIISPPLVTLIIGGFLLIIGYQPPSLILKTAGYLGNMVTPLSLILAGNIIYDTGFKNIKIDQSIILVMLMRFAVAPMIAFFVSKGLRLEDLVTQVYTIQAAMPVMVLVAVSAEAYNADSQYAASAVSITTIGSFVFIPIYMSLMQTFL